MSCWGSMFTWARVGFRASPCSGFRLRGLGSLWCKNLRFALEALRPWVLRNCQSDLEKVLPGDGRLCHLYNSFPCRLSIP